MTPEEQSTCYDYAISVLDSPTYKVKTPNKTVIHFPVVLYHNNTDKKTEYIVDYEKFFAVENRYTLLVEILGYIENLSQLNELDDERKNKLFGLLDLLEPKLLETYGEVVDDITPERYIELVDKDVVMFKKFTTDVINEGIVSALTK